MYPYILNDVAHGVKGVLHFLGNGFLPGLKNVPCTLEVRGVSVLLRAEAQMEGVPGRMGLLPGRTRPWLLRAPA